MSQPQSGPGAPPPPIQILQMITASFVSRSIAAAAELGIAEQLAAGSSSVAELATRVGADAPSLYRLLRALASVGVFQEHEDGGFSNTALSETLRGDAPDSMKSMALFLCGTQHWVAWGQLVHSLRTGNSAFERVHGKKPFEHMAGDPGFASVFDDAMTRISRQEIAAIHQRLDLSGVGTLADIGGGEGAFLTSCLARYPQLRGVLFDTPEVSAKAREAIGAAGFSARCEVLAGDFFQAVPEGADAYVLKYILHDWSDERAVTLLRNVHRAARPGSRLFVLDTVVKPGNTPDFAKLLDVQVLMFYGGGRERTRAEFDALFARAGYRLGRVLDTPGILSILEAERVDTTG